MRFAALDSWAAQQTFLHHRQEMPRPSVAKSQGRKTGLQVGGTALLSSLSVIQRETNNLRAHACRRGNLTLSSEQQFVKKKKEKKRKKM